MQPVLLSYLLHILSKTGITPSSDPYRGLKDYITQLHFEEANSTCSIAGNPEMMLFPPPTLLRDIFARHLSDSKISILSPPASGSL